MRRETPLSRTAPFYRMSGGLFGRLRFRTGHFKTAQNFVCGVLQPCIRLVKLTGCLACQRTELVAIGHMRKCLKNEIGTHCVSPSSSNCRSGNEPLSRQCSRGKPIQAKYKFRAAPNCNFHILDALWLPAVQKHLVAVARYEMDAIPYRICSSRAGNRGTRLAFRGCGKTQPCINEALALS
jgi:hypothetical protein